MTTKNNDPFSKSNGTAYEPGFGTMTRDFNYSEIKTIPLSEVANYVKSAKDGKWCVVRIEPFWDREKFLEDLRENSLLVPYMKKDPEIYSESYEGISIQKTKHELTSHQENYNSIQRNVLPGEPILFGDGTLYFTKEGFSKTPLPNVQLIEMDEKKREVWKTILSKPTVTAPQYLNDWAGVFSDFLIRLAEKGLVCLRGRYLRTIPGQYAGRHWDGECRLHIPLWTNDKVFTTFFDAKRNYEQINKYHMPADGSAYLFNAYVAHNFGNFGDELRTHAVFGIVSQYHSSWKEFQPHLTTYEDVLHDYVKDLMRVRNIK
jgi:hypothetical protein